MKMPVLFIGHGSPMNAIEKNKYSNNWSKIALTIPKPKAILVISAHWYTEGTLISDKDKLDQIYDMYGFPSELYNLKYQPLGNPTLAHHIIDILGNAMIDNSFGLDHGAWSVLNKMYPKANISVIELSIDGNKSPKDLYEIGTKLKVLRKQGVLIIGSGNVVHNLGLVDWNMTDGYEWAKDFDNYICNKIKKHKYEDVINYELSPKYVKEVFMTREHIDPLFYVLGATDEKDKVHVFNHSCMLGSLSMTCYLFK